MTKNRALAAGRQSRILPTAASLIALMASLAAPGASAADLTLQAGDNTTPVRFSFNAASGATNWPGQLAAASGNNYFTNGLQLRSNPGASLTVTFAGDQLNLQNSILALRGGTGSTTNVGSNMIVTGTGAGINNGAGTTAQTLASNAAIQLASGSVFTLNPGDNTRTLTVSAAMAGAGSVVVTNTSTAGATILSNTNNAYTGNTTVTGTGLLQMGAATALPDAVTAGDLVIAKGTVTNGGTVQLLGNATTTQGLADGAGGGGVVENAGASDAILTIQGNTTGDRTFSGTIQDGSGGGNLGLTKTGSTTREILTGANTYTGATTISGGTLQIENNSALGTATGTADGTVINGTGVLGLNNGVSSAEYLTMAGRDSANTNPDAVVSTGNNTLTGPIVLTATGATGVNFAFSSASGTLTVGGPITGDGPNALIFRGAGDTVVNGSITLTEAGSDHEVAGEGSGAKTIAGAVDLSGSRMANIVNDGTGSLTFNGPVKMNDVTGNAWVGAEDGNLSVTGTLEMKNAAGGAVIANNGAGAVSVAGADMSGAKAGNAVWNDVGGSLTVGSVAVAGVLNMSGAQGTWSQVVNSGAGSVVVYSDIDMRNSTATNSVVGNRGAGSLTVNGDIDMTGSTGTRQVGNVGSGSTTVNGTLTNVAEAGATAGTFIVGQGADLTDVDKLGVGAGATIDATDVVSDFTIVSGQTLYGAGEVIAPTESVQMLSGAGGVMAPTGGDVVAAAGSIIDMGNGLHTDFATLTILGDMTLEKDSLIQVNLDPTGAGGFDLLAVSQILKIVDMARLQFFWSVAPTALVYTFASYATIDRASGAEFAVTDAPTGYHIDYGYQGQYVALVSDIPVPAPLFLMGLGALIMGAGRRYAKR